MSETIELAGTDNCISVVVNNATWASFVKGDVTKETTGHTADERDMSFEAYELELGVWTVDTDGTIVSKEARYVEPAIPE